MLENMLSVVVKNVKSHKGPEQRKRQHICKSTTPQKSTGSQNLPAQHSQDQVEYKEGSKDDQTDKVDPRQLKAHCIIHLHGNTSREREKEDYT